MNAKQRRTAQRRAQSIHGKNAVWRAWLNHTGEPVQVQHYLTEDRVSVFAPELAKIGRYAVFVASLRDLRVAKEAA